MKLWFTGVLILATMLANVASELGDLQVCVTKGCVCDANISAVSQKLKDEDSIKPMHSVGKMLTMDDRFQADYGTSQRRELNAAAGGGQAGLYGRGNTGSGNRGNAGAGSKVNSGAGAGGASSGKYKASCAEAFTGAEGSYIIQIGKRNPVKLRCIADRAINGRAWTVVLRRNGGTVDFGRSLADYERGFGNIDGDHFIGLDLLHAMTSTRRHEVWISASNGDRVAHARYDRFAIGDSTESYILHTLGQQLEILSFDNFRTHMGNRFSAKNRDFTKNSCTSNLNAGWWFYETSIFEEHPCADTYLTGSYTNQELPEFTFHNLDINGTKVKTAIMAIRPWSGV